MVRNDLISGNWTSSYPLLRMKTLMELNPKKPKFALFFFAKCFEPDSLSIQKNSFWIEIDFLGLRWKQISPGSRISSMSPKMPRKTLSKLQMQTRIFWSSAWLNLKRTCSTYLRYCSRIQGVNRTTSVHDKPHNKAKHLIQFQAFLCDYSSLRILTVTYNLMRYKAYNFLLISKWFDKYVKP